MSSCVKPSFYIKVAFCWNLPQTKDLAETSRIKLLLGIKEDLKTTSFSVETATVMASAPARQPNNKVGSLNLIPASF